MISPRRWLRPLAVLAAALALCCLDSATGHPSPVVLDAAEAVRLPADAFAFLHVRVDTLMGTGPLAHVQRQVKAEVIAKLLEGPKEALGVDLRDVEFVTFAVVLGGPETFNPYLHIRTKQPVVRKDVLATLPNAKEQAVAGLYAREDDDHDRMGAIRFFDDRSFARGPKVLLGLMENEPPSNETRRRHAAALGVLDKHHVVASFAPTPDLKNFLSGNLREGGRLHNFEDIIVRMALEAVVSLETGHATLDLVPQPRLNLNLRFADPRQAQRAARMLHASILSLQALAASVSTDEQQVSSGLPPMKESRKVVQALVAALDEARVEQKGGEVTFAFEPNLPEGLLNRAAMEAVLQVRTAAMGMTRRNNLRQVIIAMHNYHEAHGRMPSNYCDAQGKPILSWRVALLPYMGNDALFRQFKTDEPWDSPNNKPLIEKMPLYYHVAGGTAAPGQTHIQVFMTAPDYKGRYAPAFRFGPAHLQRTLAQMTVLDGTSNTLCVAEATKPVTWTKPDDIMIDKDIEDLTKPGPALGAIPDDPYFLAGFGDGAVRSLRRSLPDAAKFKRILRTCIGVGDGEVEDFSQIDADFTGARHTFDSVGDRIEVKPSAPPKANPPPAEPPPSPPRR